MSGPAVGTVREWMQDVLETGVQVLHRRRREMWWGASVTLPENEAPRPARPEDVLWRFSGPGGEACGIGEAARFSFERPPVLGSMAVAARALGRERDLPAGARLGGGIAFLSRTPGGAWRGFPAGQLVLPVLTVERPGDGTVRVHLAAQLKPEMPVRRLYHLLLPTHDETQAPAKGPEARVVDAQFRSTPARFRELVREALVFIEQGRFEKVVLARSLELRLEEAVAAERVYEALGPDAELAERFFVRCGEGVLVGASPELLAQVRDGRVQSASLAGTAERGSDPELLLQNPKERTEHEWVRRFLADALGEVADRVDIPDVPVVQAAGPVQHLYTPAVGQLKAGLDIWDVLQVLHPTPAVGGFPRETAVSFIRDREGFDRGWYAGAVGSVSLAGEGAFHVALRSGLVRGTRVVLYGGAGVVSGSDPEHELMETGWKCLPMLRALARA